jgi:gamma-polyglutamate synthase
LPEPAVDPVPEVLESPGRADLDEHFTRQLARLVVHARLRARLRALVAGGAAAAGAAELHDAFRKAYALLFEETVVIVHNPGETGDQIIDRVARSVPPGTEVACMGIQNIKGTGLDWVYRWVAVDKVLTALGRLASPRADVRAAALLELEGFEDHGLVDSGVARLAIARHAARGDLPADELETTTRVGKKLEEVYTLRRERLTKSVAKGRLSKVIDWVEGWVDHLDAVRRFRDSRKLMRDLVDERISHGRAVIEMRDLYARQKGGWLDKTLRAGVRSIFAVEGKK